MSKDKTSFGTSYTSYVYLHFFTKFLEWRGSLWGYRWKGAITIGWPENPVKPSMMGRKTSAKNISQSPTKRAEITMKNIESCTWASPEQHPPCDLHQDRWDEWDSYTSLIWVSSEYIITLFKEDTQLEVMLPSSAESKTARRGGVCLSVDQVASQCPEMPVWQRSLPTRS